ncbi:hypothetical protein [Streptomyces caniscabiei]|uniref:hypothetical protein n=1 Tax=Streptomyces caniscabiei TaxID=2746961 RepID=UPI001F2AFEE8|nr:hypothetical protein [Streptomyces caniscabiei]
MPVTLDMPGKVADFLRATEMGDAELAALDHGVTVGRGQGYTLRVSATPAVHRQFLARCHPSTALKVPRPSRHSARPAAKTRTGSAPFPDRTMIIANSCSRCIKAGQRCR